MNWEEWFTLAVLIFTVIALAREILPPAATILGAVVILLIAGVLTPQQAFSGFSNPAPITVAALYVLARAVDKTGALQPLVSATRWREEIPLVADPPHLPRSGGIGIPQQHAHRGDARAPGEQLGRP